MKIEPSKKIELAVHVAAMLATRKGAEGMTTAEHHSRIAIDAVDIVESVIREVKGNK